MTASYQLVSGDVIIQANKDSHLLSTRSIEVIFLDNNFETEYTERV